MKTGLVLGGVGILLAAVYFIARRKGVLPKMASTQPSGTVKKPNPNVSLVSSLLTSQNVGAITTLFGGAAKPAEAKGVNGSGLEGIVVQNPAGSYDAPQIVTELDL